MDKINEQAVVFPCEACLGNWVVEAIDWSGDGGVIATVFSGPGAERRAVEYAQAKYREFQRHEPSQRPYLAYQGAGHTGPGSVPTHGATLRLVE